MKLTRGRVWSARSKSGCMSFAAFANEGSMDIEGSLSVFSMPTGMSGTLCENGRSRMVTVVSLRDSKMKGRLAGVVKMVTVRLRWRSKRARWRSGMVWPLDIKGKRTTWCGCESPQIEPISFFFLLPFPLLRYFSLSFSLARYLASTCCLV